MTKSVALTAAPVEIASLLEQGKRYQVELVDTGGTEKARMWEGGAGTAAADARASAAYHSLRQGAVMEMYVLGTEKLWAWMESGSGTLAITAAVPDRY